eukprot:TRINITY_DN8359_c0_g1_i1.p1 TRINITY_DN8359_c0_g1~~TRINITY_DN8359_c0_g1_i1.p1  ORF type:complete len:422 (+),score=171.99 TRINITY_DN8359_c0_g1_i1:125-1390(+)
MGCGASKGNKYKEGNQPSDPPAAKEDSGKAEGAAAGTAEAAATTPPPPASAAEAAIPAEGGSAPEEKSKSPPTQEEPAPPAAAAAEEAPPAEQAPEAPAPAAEKEEAEAEESESEGEDEVVDDAEVAKKLAARNAKGVRTQAICGESAEKDPNWMAPVHEKTSEQEARLTSALSRSFIFSSLQKEDLETVIKAFMAHPVAGGEVVIQQGAEVNSEEPALFVLEEGMADVFKKGIEDPVFVYDKAGQYFGELALLYNAPRAATVKARTDCTLWAIDRTTFNYLVKDAARQAKERRVEFLKSVPLFANLSEDDVYKLSDAFEVLNVATSTEIIRQDEMGTDFFIVEKGTAVCTKNGEEVLSYDDRGFFGELALLAAQSRAATVTTTSDCRLLKLDGQGFNRLIPSSVREDMVARAAEIYGIKV